MKKQFIEIEYRDQARHLIDRTICEVRTTVNDCLRDWLDTHHGVYIGEQIKIRKATNPR